MANRLIPREEYLQRYDLNPINGCWEWNAHQARHGYGRFYERGKLRLAHRASYEFYVGPIPDGMFVCHKCDNPKCINPDHLFIGTHMDNMRDQQKKGRQLRGEANARSKLTEEIVRAMRRDRSAGVMGKDLAIKYNTSIHNVWAVVRRHTWQHI